MEFKQHEKKHCSITETPVINWRFSPTRTIPSDNVDQLRRNHLDDIYTL